MPADPTKLAEARAALAVHDHHPREVCPECCEDVCDPCVDALRWALAEVDRLTAEMTEARKPFAYADPLADANGNRHHKDGSRCTDAYCRRAHALPVAVNVTPCPLPCPTCGYNDVPGTTHSTACLYSDAKVTP